VLLALLRGEGYPPGADRRERDRLQHRARGYEWRGTHLVRQTGGGVRVVPRVEARNRLIRDVHERAGHIGVKKTHSVLRPHYWWVGLLTDVARVVRSCEACNRVRATFNAKHPALHPLSIKGLFYRWGLDFAGPLPKSSRGNQYVLVMVKHFSKTVILVPTVDKEPSTVAAAFTREVLTRFGACAEVVTDRGGEFGAEFQKCLDAALIDHRSMSAHHPQANGLSEQIVQVVKRALRKWCLGHAAEQWDLYLPWVAMGYNFSVQTSLAGFSSYQLLHGRELVMQGALKVAVQEPLDMDDPKRLVALVAERAAKFQQWMPMAMGNLEIAQHCNMLRYAHTRSGAWKPKAISYGVDGLRLPAAGDARHAGHKGGPADFESSDGEAERGSRVRRGGRAHSEGAYGAVRPLPPTRHRRAGGPKAGGALQRLCVHAVPEGQWRKEHAAVRRLSCHHASRPYHVRCAQ
jgi:hypothetical protein